MNKQFISVLLHHNTHLLCHQLLQTLNYGTKHNHKKVSIKVATEVFDPFMTTDYYGTRYCFNKALHSHMEK